MKEFFARLNPMERRFVVGVGVVFFLVINMVWVWPHFGDWSETRSAMTEARRKVGLFEGGIGQIPALRTAIAKYQHKSEVIPSDDQAVYFFKLIQNQATASHVGIISMGSTRQSIDTNNPYFVEQNQTITTQSGEKELVDFLYNLGAGTSLIRVRELSVQPDPPHQQLTARVTLVASYQKKASAGKAGAAPSTGTPAPQKATGPAAAKAATPASNPAAAKPNPTMPKPTPAAPKANPTGPNPISPRPLLPGQMNRPFPTNAQKLLTPNKQ